MQCPPIRSRKVKRLQKDLRTENERKNPRPMTWTSMHPDYSSYEPDYSRTRRFGTLCLCVIPLVCSIGCHLSSNRTVEWFPPPPRGITSHTEKDLTPMNRCKLRMWGKKRCLVCENLRVSTSQELWWLLPIAVIFRACVTWDTDPLSFGNHPTVLPL